MKDLLEIDNIPYTIAVENPGSTDLSGFRNNLEKVIPVTTGLIGDIPYRHYSLLITDRLKFTVWENPNMPIRWQFMPGASSMTRIMRKRQRMDEILKHLMPGYNNSITHPALFIIHHLKSILPVTAGDRG